MKVFVTGATGYLGAHLATRLACAEYKLVCLVRRTSRTEHLEQLGAGLVVGDITDKASLIRGMSCCDSVINLAANVHFWQPEKRIYTDVNVEGTRNVMEAALEAGVHKVVHVSSAAIYGEPVDCPFAEDSPVGPVRRSEYTRTKYAGDLVAWELYEKKGLPLVVVYPGAVVGPGDLNPTGQQIKAYVWRRLAEGPPADSLLTCVHPSDVTAAIVGALEKQDNIGEKYLVGKHQLSYQDFEGLVIGISGVPLLDAPLPDCLVLATAAFVAGTKMRFDGRKAERELGISYTAMHVALEEAIVSQKGTPVLAATEDTTGGF